MTPYSLFHTNSGPALKLVKGGASPPSILTYSGINAGTTQTELLNNLSTSAKRLMFGKYTSELNAMLPPPQQNDVLVLVAEGRLLYGHNMAMALANGIHRRAHLIPEQIPVLQAVIHELLTNSIEHGNLGLSSVRTESVNEEDWFDTYQDDVHTKLAGPLGRIPVMITCQREGSSLTVTITDRGMGFAFRHIMTQVQTNTLPTGRGISLVYAMLGGQLEYTDGGRSVTFKVSVRERTEVQMPNRFSVHEHARILLIDDHQLTSRIAANAFKKAGFRHILMVNKSDEALQAAIDFKPDLIILDIVMEGTDGFELFSQIKGQPETAETPVIFFSALTDADQRKRGYRMGAVDFVSKPIEPAELVARAETHVLGGIMLHKLHGITNQLAEDIERARVFQQSLMPSPAQLGAIANHHGLDISTIYQGCDTLAGDYWNIIHIDQSHIAFTMVDFTGHGVIAALNTVQFHTLLNAHASNTNPLVMVKLLNHHLYKILATGNFATCVYGVLNTHTGDLAYAGCGAPDMLLRDAQGNTSRLDCKGLPLGISDDLPAEISTVKLHPGDSILAYSDALTDSPHQDGSRWEIDGLLKMVNSLPATYGSQQTVSAVLDSFYGTVQLPVPDDLSLISITFMGHKPVLG